MSRSGPRWRALRALTVTCLATAMLAAPALAQSVAAPPPDDAPFFEEPGPPSIEPLPPPLPRPPMQEPPQPALAGAWMAQGPNYATMGQVEGIAEGRVVGAIHAVAAHPTDADILYVGAVNGGVWKSTNATMATPTFTPLTDSEASLSIGALEFDPTDATNMTLVAGIGRYSSFGGVGGDRTGLLRTTDGGATWTAIDGGLGVGKRNISGVAPRGSTIVVSVNSADVFSCTEFGIWRTTDLGATPFVRTTGIPDGQAFDLASDPTAPAVLFTGLSLAPFCSLGVASNGIYKSTDTGATWTKVSTAAMDAFIVDFFTNNIEIAARGMDVFVNIIQAGQTAAIFQSDDGGTTWVAMDLPLIPVGPPATVAMASFTTPITITTTLPHGFPPGRKVEIMGVMGNVAANGVWDITAITPDTFDLVGSAGSGAYAGGGTAQLLTGANPRQKPGGQGAIHASIVIDPTTPDTFYVGGDRQDTPFPNFLGAIDFSGALWRADSTVAPTGGVPSPQWEHLTHSSAIGLIPGGGTASGSSPHADSREMVFDAAGNLIEVDDGGIYRRTTPGANTGDWFSLNNLQVSEQHDVAYDTVSNIIFSGNQDTGTTQQSTPGSTTWVSLSTADGGDVAVNDAGATSFRYSSFQNLGAFAQREFDATNMLVATDFPALTVSGGGDAFMPAFVTPVVINEVDMARSIVAGCNSLYESADGFTTIAQIPGLDDPGCMGGGIMPGQNAIAAGAPGNADALIVGSGTSVYFRTTGGGALTMSGTYPGTATVRDVAFHPTLPMTAVAIDSTKVFYTTDMGATWTDITSNLVDTRLGSVAFVQNGSGYLVVGGRSGVKALPLPPPGMWSTVGTGFPNAPVFDLDFDPADKVLVAGTMGRGAWKFSTAPCFALTLSHTGTGADPTAAPAMSAGCPAGQYTAGEMITLTAAPGAGFTVGSWTGTANDASTATTNTLTMPAAPATVSVNYVPVPCPATTTVTGDQNGTATIEASMEITVGAATFKSGSNTTLGAPTVTFQNGATFEASASATVTNTGCTP